MDVMSNYLLNKQVYSHRQMLHSDLIREFSFCSDGLKLRLMADQYAVNK